MITPLPNVWQAKPGSATLPFFGVQPAILDEKGVELSGVCEGYLAIKVRLVCWVGVGALYGRRALLLRPSCARARAHAPAPPAPPPKKTRHKQTTKRHKKTKQNKAAWPAALRTVYGDHERYETNYFRPFPGYYFSGDGARRDADGYYWITGRVDDVINVSGHRIGTAEVESALVAHAACAEAAVVGYEHAIKGQGIYAYVTLMERVEPSEELRKELVGSVRAIIGAFAAPDVIHWAPGLPKTRSGKIMVRERLLCVCCVLCAARWAGEGRPFDLSGGSPRSRRPSHTQKKPTEANTQTHTHKSQTHATAPHPAQDRGARGARARRREHARRPRRRAAAARPARQVAVQQLLSTCAAK